MPKGRLEYPAEFRQRMVELVRAGRSAGDLAKEFEPTARSIRNWVREAAAAESGGGESLTAAEREELRQLRRENRRLREEREILAKAAAWFARETGSIPRKDSDS
jgi:transposase